MPSITVRTDTGAAETAIPGEGVLVPASGASTVFDDASRVGRLKADASFATLLTDDAFGVGLSTLVLIDLAGNDVGQGLALDFLAAIGGPSNVTAAARDSVNSDLIYYGRSSASVGSENPAAAEYQIYRSDDQVRPFVRAYADGNELFDNVWDDRESLFGWFTSLVAPHEPNVLLAWEYKETTGLIAEDSGLANNDGTHTGSLSIAQPPDHPDALYSVLYNGISGRTLSAGGVFDWSLDHTIGLRFRSDSGASTRVVFYSAAAVGYLALLIAADEDIELRFYDGVTLHTHTLVGDYHDGLWHDIVYRIDHTGSKLDLWLDAVQQATITMTANPATGDGILWMGDGPFLAAHLGYIELPVVFSKLLTDGEAAGLYA